MIERVDEGGFLGFELGSDGSRAGELTIPAGGSRAPATAGTVDETLHTIHMNGREVFRFATGAIVSSAERLLDACGVSVEEIDLYAVHQANRRIIDHAVERLGLDAGKVLLNIDRYGNTSSASIPLVLAEALETGRLEPGSAVLMTTVGAGLAWGSALVRWTASGAAAG